MIGPPWLTIPPPNSGPEAQRIASDFYSQSVKIVSSGGLNAETYESVKKLLQQKKEELAQFSQKAGRDAWDASAKAAGPALDKMPDVKEVVDNNLGKVEGYLGEDRVKVRLPILGCRLKPFVGEN